MSFSGAYLLQFASQRQRQTEPRDQEPLSRAMPAAPTESDGRPHLCPIADSGRPGPWAPRSLVDPLAVDQESA
jgi:hypothetical protein